MRKLTYSEYQLLCDCVSIYENQNDKLSQFERDFMSGKGPNDQYDSLVEKFEKYGEEVKMTDKQINVLQKMYDKVILGIQPKWAR